jgi:hypothetical protein
MFSRFSLFSGRARTSRAAPYCRPEAYATRSVKKSQGSNVFHTRGKNLSQLESFMLRTKSLDRSGTAPRVQCEDSACRGLTQHRASRAT